MKQIDLKLTEGLELDTLEIKTDLYIKVCVDVESTTNPSPDVIKWTAKLYVSKTLADAGGMDVKLANYLHPRKKTLDGRIEVSEIIYSTEIINDNTELSDASLLEVKPLIINTIASIVGKESTTIENLI